MSRMAQYSVLALQQWPADLPRQACTKEGALPSQKNHGALNQRFKMVDRDPAPGHESKMPGRLKNSQKPRCFVFGF